MRNSACSPRNWTWFRARLDYLLGRGFCCRDGQVNEDTLRSLNDWLVS
jgi:hypothetical protein